MIGSINLLYLCFFSKMGILLPYLAAYYRSVGIPETMLGYLFAIFAIVNSLAPIAWGAIGDRLRSVKLNLAINFGGAFISLFTLFLTDNFYWILLSVAASSFFMSGVQPILDATAISIEKKRVIHTER
ncbi:MFS transporter [Candidatus Enterovibrio escicola]|uniref:MFS transporter n=1 Tax=Candidatus Enterovibrio escicola TaxID=1927127 RepID=UPI001237ECA4|nr:MFS transporter [Candidatus Enterovibrio escacola]